METVTASDIPSSETETFPDSFQSANRTLNNLARFETYLHTNAFTFLTLLTYALSLLLMFLWGAHDEYMYKKTPKRRWVIAVARGFGYSLNINAALVILLACRLTFTLIRNTPLCMIIPFDKSFPDFHVLVGYTIAVSVLFHGVFHLVWIIVWNGWKEGLWMINMSVATGILTAIVLGIMVLSSLPHVRRSRFTLFYFVHNICAVLFFGLLLVHGVYNGVPYTYKWLVGPLVLYALDRIVRKVRVSTFDVHVTASNSILREDNIMKIRVPKRFSFRAGQYAEIKVPAISKFEWHPFTIASAPFEESMCFYIKAVGDWTKQLRQSFTERLNGKTSIPLKVLIRGPFGAPAQHVRGYQRVVLISGGVGATPFASICKDLFHHITTQMKLTYQDDQPEPESPAMIRAEKDMRSCLSNIYDKNANQFAEEEAYLSASKMIPMTDLLSEKEEQGEFFSPFSEASEQPLEQNIYLDKLGFSFRQEKDKNAGRLTPVFLAREARYTVFERTLAKTMITADASEVGDNIRVDFFAPKAEKLLMFFHSVMLNMVLCISLLLRITFVACASIFRSSVFSPSKISTKTIREVVFAGLDAGLSIFVLGVLLMSFIAELFVYRLAFFNKLARIGDVMILLPVSFFSILHPLRILLDDNVMFNVTPVVHFWVILPLLTIALCHRLYHVIGVKIAMADYAREPSLEKLRAVDFIWTAPYAAEDKWLREELEPVANGRELRLLRFLTREEREVSEEGVGHRGIITTYGRPDWENVLTKLSERTPSGGKVGVFCCGPKSMSKAIASAIKKAQILSSLRGIYLRTSSDNALRSELDVEPEDLRRLRLRGCNVRFVFREENFS